MVSLKQDVELLKTAAEDLPPCRGRAIVINVNNSNYQNLFSG